MTDKSSAKSAEIPNPKPEGKTKMWKCLGCKTEEPTLTDTNYQIRCDCFNKNFVCMKCWTAKPDINYWQGIFGPEHALRDRVKGSFMLQWMSQNMGKYATAGMPNPDNKPVIGKKLGDNVTVITPDQFTNMFGPERPPAQQAPKPGTK